MTEVNFSNVIAEIRPDPFGGVLGGLTPSKP